MLGIVQVPLPLGASEAMQDAEPTLTVAESVVGSLSPWAVVTVTVNTDCDSLP